MELHVKTTMRFLHLNPVRMVKYITTMKTNAVKDMGTRRFIAFVSTQLHSHVESIFSLQKTENQSISRPTYSTLVYNTKRFFWKDSFSSMFTVTFFIIARKCISER